VILKELLTARSRQSLALVGLLGFVFGFFSRRSADPKGLRGFASLNIFNKGVGG
jgi:hypothetical protein